MRLGYTVLTRGEEQRDKVEAAIEATRQAGAWVEDHPDMHDDADYFYTLAEKLSEALQIKRLADQQ